MINIKDELKNNFFIYASCVNNERSFPDSRDGLKPGMRATLWEMYTKGYSSNKPHVKCAKVSGGTIATWWPHGDVGIYEAMVRLSQDWINNIPAIDFHGSNGSLIGGPEAANQRYTECRLAESSEDCYFKNIKKDTVNFIDNFSEDEKWPEVFPSIAPILLCNGSSGIGYTIAQDWLPHNLNEVFEKIKEYISTGKISVNDIYPDYPTGGIIINKKDCHTIYETGKGSVILRGKTIVEDNLIKITELPYQVYAEPFIQKVKDLVNSDQLTGIEDICNKSDDSGLLIEIECSADANLVLKKLYKLTDLQTTFSANQMALVDGIPQMLNLQDYIKVYVDHNLTCLQREYKYDLDKANARKEIVEGLVKALTNIDLIIKVIKDSISSDAAKKDLINKFEFTENQAKAIIDMRLGKLAHLETKELEDELANLLKIIAECESILKSKKKQEKIFLNRLDDFVAKYGWERRTQLADIDIVKEKAETKPRIKKSEEQCIIALTKGNYIKRIPLVSYKPQTKILSEEERIIQTVKIGVKDKVILIGENGLMYKLQANKITQCNTNSTGTSLYDLLGTKILSIYSGQEDKKYLFMLTNDGQAKKIESQLIFNISKSTGTLIMKLNNDKIIHCYLVDDKDEIKVCVNNKIKTINTAKFNIHGKNAGGVSCIKLKDNQSITIIED